MKRGILLIALISLPLTVHAKVIFYQGFEDGKLPQSDQDGFRVSNNHCCTHSLQNVTTYAAQGAHSLYTVVLQGDPPVKGTRCSGAAQHGSRRQHRRHAGATSRN